VYNVYTQDCNQCHALNISMMLYSLLKKPNIYLKNTTHYITAILNYNILKYTMCVSRVKSVTTAD